MRDFGALGDGITDDHAAFAAAITAAQSRAALVYVPASATPYVLGDTIVLDALTMIGDGAGSTLKVGLPSGAGVHLAGSGAGLIGLRVLGPGASTWPGSPSDVDLSGVALDGVKIASEAEDVTLQNVEVAGCATALAIEGGVKAVVGCAFSYSLRGIEIRTGASGAIFVKRTRFHACTTGIRASGTAIFDQLAVHGGGMSACGHGLDLVAPASAWRTVEMSDLQLTQNLKADLEAGPRQSLALRGGHLDASGKRNGAAVELNAAGQTVLAPNLTAENVFAATRLVRSVQLSGGTNLNLLAPGDLIVLASDPDDLDDLWTSLKATRGGVVHKVNAQTASTATIELATATMLPIIIAADTIRVVGRSGTAIVSSVGGAAPAAASTWLRADNHCRVFSANNPMPVTQIELEGPNADLRDFPGLTGEPVRVSGVELNHGAVNGALVRMFTFTIAQNAAVSFTPPATTGMVQTFAQSLALGDPIAAIFSYRADALGYTELLAKGTTTPTNDVMVLQRTALTGTTGSRREVHLLRAHGRQDLYREPPVGATAHGCCPCNRRCRLSCSASTKGTEGARHARSRRSAFASSSGCGTGARGSARRPSIWQWRTGLVGAGATVIAAWSCSCSAAPASRRWSGSSAPGCWRMIPTCASWCSRPSMTSRARWCATSSASSSVIR